MNFIGATRRYLCDEYPARLRRALDGVSEEDLWWRPNAESNSIGVLLAHLAGNVRQWVVSGVGQRPDVRDRPAEFALREGSLEDLLARLDTVLDEVGGVLDALDPDQLSDPREIQGVEVEVGEALYHVVEHFSMHLGQIIWIVKARTGRDLEMYEVDSDGRVLGTHW